MAAIPQGAPEFDGAGLVAGLTDWALRLGDQYDSTARHVALLFALHVNEHGAAFAGITRLARLARLNYRTVRERIEQLIAGGELEDTGQRAGRRGTTPILRVVGFVPAVFQLERLRRAGLAPSPSPTVDKLSTPPAETAPTVAVEAPTVVLRVQPNSGTLSNTGEAPKTEQPTAEQPLAKQGPPASFIAWKERFKRGETAAPQAMPLEQQPAPDDSQVAAPPQTRQEGAGATITSWVGATVQRTREAARKAQERVHSLGSTLEGGFDALVQRVKREEGRRRPSPPPPWAPRPA